MPKDAFYIKLDTNARNDPKVKILEKYYGIKGFGVYVALDLLLRETDGNGLEYGDSTWDSLCDEFSFTPEELKEFVDCCIDKCTQKGKGLFCQEDGSFYSERINRDVSWLEEKREKTRLAGKISAEKRYGKPALTPEQQEYITAEIKTEFSDLDIEEETKKFTLYWSEGGRKLKRPKTAFRNWLVNARKFQGEKQPPKTSGVRLEGMEVL